MCCMVQEPRTFIEESLTSQRISEILSTIGIDEKQTFLGRWMDKILEEDYLCYDITSISSFSEFNEYIKYAHNRDKEKLPQMNLAILFGQKGRLPVYFQRTPGNITDVTTLHNLLKTFKALEKKTIHYVMDKGDSIVRKTLMNCLRREINFSYQFL